MIAEIDNCFRWTVHGEHKPVTSFSPMGLIILWAILCECLPKKFSKHGRYIRGLTARVVLLCAWPYAA